MSLCDVNHCAEKSVGEYNQSSFCREHLKNFTDEYEQAHEELEIENVHPLRNPESTHYQMVDGVEAIERMEQMYSIPELMIWAKITSMKYRLRIGNKDSVEKDAVKIAGYEAYYHYLYRIQS